MHADIDTLFEHLWQDYLTITPSAKRVHRLLGGNERQNSLVNDHIALRTFNQANVGLDKLAKHFVDLGYQEKGQYQFQQKKLNAKHFEHPNLTKPKVFISELLVEQMSPAVQSIIQTLLEQVPAQAAIQANFLYSGAHWQVSRQDYNTLLAESEYAAWMSVWGFRANHFTVNVNHLQGYANLEQVNQTLKQAGFSLNTSGGEIKGGKEVCLAQSSTMADHIEVTFSDGSLSVPSCFYEFAERFALANGELYQGFVAASADKIFESTHVN